jgi:hypothetical protein
MRGTAGLTAMVAPGLILLCTANAAAHPRLAPADEYFGRAKMSPLEITNRIRDAERRGGSYRGLMSTQSAIEDWAAKYPGDPWIPPREYRISRLFASLHSRDGYAEADHCRSFLRAHFPGTPYATAATRDTRSYKAVATKRAAKKKHHFLGITWT